jgi:CYTH domain-containing protein
MCHGHKKPQEQKLKERSKSYFQIRNKIRLRDSKTRTHKLRIRTQDVQNNMKIKFYYANICKHEHEKKMTRLWCKIVLKTNVEHVERNEGFYFYLYPFGELTQKNFQGGFYVCIK